MPTISMIYGTESISPVPLVTLTKSYHRTPDDTKLGVLFNMRLNGVATNLPSTAGLTNTFNKLENIRETFAEEGRAFAIICDGTILWSGHPRVTNISFDNTSNNWAQTINYSVDLEFDVDLIGNNAEKTTEPFIESAVDSWSMEFAQDNSKFSWGLPTIGTDANPYIINITHNISAKGKRHYIPAPGGLEASVGEVVNKLPWQQARAYVLTKLSTGADSAFTTQLASSGVNNLNSTLFSAYNHYRVQNTDINGGEFSVNESWIVMDTGVGIPGHALEDFTINVREDLETDLTTVSIEGSIQGVETRSHGSVPGNFTITETKYNAASGYWATVKNRIYYRSQHIHEGTITGENRRTLNTTPLSFSIGHNLPKGVITYSYTYDDRPSNCITGARYETINIVDNNPLDVFTQIPILGRAAGPILQNINTVTTPTREVSIELVGAPSVSCTAANLIVPTNHMKTDVATLLCAFQTALTDVYDEVYKHADTENWNPKTGRYSRHVGWTYQDCSISGTTTLC